MTMAEQLYAIRRKRHKLRILRHSVRVLNEVATPKARELLCRLEKHRIALSFELLTDLDAARANLEKA